jgi:hypothetical protein
MLSKVSLHRNVKPSNTPQCQTRWNLEHGL